MASASWCQAWERASAGVLLDGVGVGRVSAEKVDRLRRRQPARIAELGVDVAVVVVPRFGAAGKGVLPAKAGGRAFGAACGRACCVVRPETAVAVGRATWGRGGRRNLTGEGDGPEGLFSEAAAACVRGL